MDSGANPDGCKREIAASCCSNCSSPGRVKDRRLVIQVVPDGHGGADRILVPRVRLWCPTPACHKRSWTVYERGAYPRRKLTLALGAAAVVAIQEEPGATLSSLAVRFRCHRRTVGRLVVWVGRISKVASEAERYAEIAPGPPAPPLPAPPRTERPAPRIKGLDLAGPLVLLLEQVASLLRARGVSLEAGPGLAVLLRDQFEHWGEVFYVTDASPPALRIPWPPGVPAS